MKEIRDIHEMRSPDRAVALLDSDSGFLVVLGKRLEAAGWEQIHLPRRTTPKRAAAAATEALVVDIAMLGARRMAWLRSLCEVRPELSVIVCTADSTVAERVIALRAGVDDWLAKPCHPEELLARLEGASLRRRSCRRETVRPASFGEIEIRPDVYQAFAAGHSLELTRREYQLLGLLCEAGGEVLQRQRIYECLWGYEMVRNDRSVDVFVHKLRRKLERYSPGWSYIHTHFGVGYRLAPERVAETETLAA